MKIVYVDSEDGRGVGPAERTKVQSRRKRKARRRVVAQGQIPKPKVRPMSDARIKRIVRRIPAVLESKFPEGCTGSLDNIALALKSEGAMKEHNYGNPADRQQTMRLALQLAIQQGTVVAEELLCGNFKITHVDIVEPCEADGHLDNTMFKHCRSPYISELRAYAA